MSHCSTSFLGRPINPAQIERNRNVIPRTLSPGVSVANVRASTSKKGSKKAAAGKGFGARRETVEKANSESKSLEPMQLPCPCGGGEEKLQYVQCCGRFHGGVREPDAATLMRARYSAFARGMVPYLVRTTHPEHPDMAGQGGAKQLQADCETTCARLVFKGLEILNTEDGSTEDEAFVTFRAMYAYKHGTTGENQVLVEKSRFVRVGEDVGSTGGALGRWFYREKIAIDLASEAAWKNGARLFKKEESSDPRRYNKFGRPQPGLSPRRM